MTMTLLNQFVRRAAAGDDRIRVLLVRRRLDPGEDDGAGRRARGEPGDRGTRHDSRERARGQPRRRRGRPLGHRVPAAELRARSRTPISGRLCAARLLDRRGAVVAGDPRAADDRGRVRQRRERDDRRPARFEDGAQRLDVLQLGDDRRFREPTSRATSCRTSTPTTGRCRIGTAAGWSAIPWAATARRASA